MQCDQIASLCFQFGPFKTLKLCTIPYIICQSRFKILLQQNKPSKYCQSGKIWSQWFDVKNRKIFIKTRKLRHDIYAFHDLCCEIFCYLGQKLITSLNTLFENMTTYVNNYFTNSVWKSSIIIRENKHYSNILFE